MMWQREGTLKQMSFTCMKVTKGFVIVAFVQGKIQSSTIIYNCIWARAYGIVVKVLALRYDN